MATSSAGLLMFRRTEELEVLLVHPGGPYWKNKDAGAWSIPKGELAEGEEPLAAARREVAEELGLKVEGPVRALPPLKQKGGKLVYAWAVEADFDPVHLRSNTFTIEWPPRSGREQEFPEVDRAEWFPLATARQKINPAQAGLLTELERLLGE